MPPPLRVQLNPATPLQDCQLAIVRTQETEIDGFAVQTPLKLKSQAIDVKHPQLHIKNASRREGQISASSFEDTGKQRRCACIRLARNSTRRRAPCRLRARAAAKEALLDPKGAAPHTANSRAAVPLFIFATRRDAPLRLEAFQEAAEAKKNQPHDNAGATVSAQAQG
ncbi:hypothetical protein cyc_03966 [Cyclospora cayetanensis]|uniref:Uncharacterized protein n=1 Tax=Cyclospora cayetanensis TaxID=88456 RepID=A0A1D3D7Y1_9EIME|nr:hypothetical protein cyc_03966 [Cyclospora cayetanensis]